MEYKTINIAMQGPSTSFKNKNQAAHPPSILPRRHLQGGNDADLQIDSCYPRMTHRNDVEAGGFGVERVVWESRLDVP